MKTVVLFAVLSASLALAQPPRDLYPWWDLPVSKEIGLTDDQRARVEKVVREYRNKLIDLRGALEKAEADLGDAFNEENFDLKRASEAADRVAKSRADLSAAMSQMSVRLRSVLTVQQWRELQRRRPHQTQPHVGPVKPPQGVRPGPGGPGPGPGMQPGQPGQPGPRGPRRQQPPPPQPQPQPGPQGPGEAPPER
jgi:Spy/CpxP family protein refolding chaperone